MVRIKRAAGVAVALAVATCEPVAGITRYSLTKEPATESVGNGAEVGVVSFEP